MADIRRFEAKFARGEDNDCWPWLAAKHRGGYGKVYWDGEVVGAHRVAYLVYVGEIPSGMQLDHLCRNPSCVNPAHLEVVTARENTLRGLRGRMVTHCPQGHEFTEENTIWRTDRQSPHARRRCRTCAQDHNRRTTARRLRERQEARACRPGSGGETSSWVAY